MKIDEFCKPAIERPSFPSRYGRLEVIASLSWTWEGDDLAAPVEHFIAIPSAPSLTKDALSAGWLRGELNPHGSGLQGTLALTDAGRQVVDDFRSMRA